MSDWLYNPWGHISHRADENGRPLCNVARPTGFEWRLVSKPVAGPYERICKRCERGR